MNDGDQKLDDLDDPFGNASANLVLDVALTEPAVFQQTLVSEQFLPGQQCEIFQGGEKLATIIKNHISNDGSTTYVLVSTTGEKLLLAPDREVDCGIFQLSLNSLSAINCKSTKLLSVTFVAQKNKVDTLPSPVTGNIGQKPRSFVVLPHQILQIRHQVDNVLAQVYRIPNTQSYIVRDSDGLKLREVTAGDGVFQFTHPANEIFSVSAQQDLLVVAGDSSVSYVLHSLQRSFMAPVGGDVVLYATTINGGRKVAGFTRCRLGNVMKKYGSVGRNEDSFGLNQDGNLVVADGVGGHKYGEQASASVVESVVTSSGNLRDTVNRAHADLKFFNATFVEEKSGKTDFYRYAPNAAMAAILLTGDYYDAMHVGDTRWRHVRGNRCIDESVDHVIERDGRMKLTSTVLTHFIPDFVENSFLEPGDRLVLVSDGIPEDEIAHAVCSVSAEDGAMNLKDITEHYNLHGKGPNDNASAIVYVHD